MAEKEINPVVVGVYDGNSQRNHEVSDSDVSIPEDYPRSYPVRWYRGTWYNTTILGLCQFVAPGLWYAMNSLGAGGLQSPKHVNIANAITYTIMWPIGIISSALIKLVGVRGTLSWGLVGYAPYSASLYVNSFRRYNSLLYGLSALCGMSAGAYWSSEAAVVLSYPESHRKAIQLSYWMAYRVLGQMLGGAINLGVNVHKSGAGAISTNVYIVFIVLQCFGPFVAYLITPPNKAERSDGRKVRLYADKSLLGEIKSELATYLHKDFVLLIPYFAASVWTEAITNTYAAQYFSVRARSLGSFLSAITCMIAGYIEGYFLDATWMSTKTKKRSIFCVLTFIQAGIWVWSTLNQQKYSREAPIFDWSSPGFGRAFGLLIFMNISFQINYLFAFNIINDMAKSPPELIRLAAMVRANESAAQGISYGLSSITSLLTVGISAIGFGVWGISLIPSFYVVWKLGTGEYGEFDPGSVTVENEFDTPEESDLTQLTKKLFKKSSKEKNVDENQ